MPSFLSKVFGRKKDEKDPPRAQERVSDASLLEGNFETLSPSATKFPEAPNGKRQGKDKDKVPGLALFRIKSQQPPPEPEKRVDVPQLSLRLPTQRDDLETESDDQKSLTDSLIGDRRLNPVETLTLIRACSQAITARGLETLGVMHPHWYSASPGIQRRLISLFIQSLAPKSPISTLTPSVSPFVSAFESEISSARSPHDVAAVLRWGLRHLRLEGNTFGKDDDWYKNFFDNERSSEYPSTAFSTLLAPHLPGPHLELLVATLEILSLLAAHAESNGLSGSKGSKFFGLWLLTVQRAESRDDWATFYARWERMGRILEHLFLSRIRDEAVNSRMPTRLLELVHQYPYTKTSPPSPETDLLPRPRFSTCQYDALFVRIETEISTSSDEPRPHPLRLLSDAFNAETSFSDNSDHAELWASIKKAVADQTNPSPGGYPALSHIFADETIRFLSLLSSEDTDKEPLLPPFNLLIPKQPATHGRRSVSDPVASPSASTSPLISRHTKRSTDPAPSTVPSAITPSLSARSTDWAEFSASGFFEDSTARAPLAATLIQTDKDIELTVPSTPSAPTVKRSRLGPTTPLSININGGKSSGGNRTTIIKEEGTQPEKVISRATLLSLIHLDEAFIDFWADALPDPITADWPAFVICKLKEGVNGLDLTVDGGKHINWLVIEQAFKRPVVVPVEVDAAAAATDIGGSRRPRPASPKASVRSDTTLHSMKKRFSFWSANGRASVDKGTATAKGRGRKTSVQNVGEMGEILREEEEREGTIKLGFPSLKGKLGMSAEAKGKSVEVTEKSIEVPRGNGDSKANENGVVGPGFSGSVIGGAAVAVVEPAVSPPWNNSAAVVPTAAVTPARAISRVAESAPPPPHIEEVVSGPAETVFSNELEKPVVDHIPKSGPVSTNVPALAVMKNEEPAVATNVDAEANITPLPDAKPESPVETSVPPVVEQGITSADVPELEAAPVAEEVTPTPAVHDVGIVHVDSDDEGQKTEPAPAAESEPAVQEHATEEQEQVDAPAIILDTTSADQAEETETDITINVETVEPMAFSDTSSVASPVPAYVQPTVVVHTPEPVEALGHTEPLRVAQHGAEDRLVQHGVPLVEAEPTPVEPIAPDAPLVEAEPDQTTTEMEQVPPIEEPVVVHEAVEEVKKEELSPASESDVLSDATPDAAVALSTSEPVTIAQTVTVVEDEVEVCDGTAQPEHPKSNGLAMSMDSLPVPVAAQVPPIAESAPELEAGDVSDQDNVAIVPDPVVQPEDSVASAPTPPASD